ncbi:hypothetical protein [Kiloniella litopenaei]|uniref:hypothetical protein n=1 Tax=Kiloniella litopenaei TaxID=1549748 RepID=UPI003BACE1C2
MGDIFYANIVNSENNTKAAYLFSVSGVTRVWEHNIYSDQVCFMHDGETFTTDTYDIQGFSAVVLSRPGIIPEEEQGHE